MRPVNHGITADFLRTDGGLAVNRLVARDGLVAIDCHRARNGRVLQGRSPVHIERAIDIGRPLDIQVLVGNDIILEFGSSFDGKLVVKNGIAIDRQTVADIGSTRHTNRTVNGRILQGSSTVDIHVLAHGQIVACGHVTAQSGRARNLHITVDLRILRNFQGLGRGLAINGTVAGHVLVTADFGIALYCTRTLHGGITVHGGITAHGQIFHHVKPFGHGHIILEFGITVKGRSPVDRLVAVDYGIARNLLRTHGGLTAHRLVTVDRHSAGHGSVLQNGIAFHGQTAIQGSVALYGQILLRNDIILKGRLPVDIQSTVDGCITAHLDIPADIGIIGDTQIIGSGRTRDIQRFVHLHVVLETGIIIHGQSTVDGLVTVHGSVARNVQGTRRQTSINDLTTLDTAVTLHLGIAFRQGIPIGSGIALHFNILVENDIIGKPGLPVDGQVTVDGLVTADYGVAFHFLTTNRGLTADGLIAIDSHFTRNTGVLEQDVALHDKVALNGLVTPDFNTVLENGITSNTQITAKLGITDNGLRTVDHGIADHFLLKDGGLAVHGLRPINDLIARNMNVTINGRVLQRSITLNGQATIDLLVAFDQRIPIDLMVATDNGFARNEQIILDIDILIESGIIVHIQSALHLCVTAHGQVGPDIRGTVNIDIASEMRIVGHIKPALDIRVVQVGSPIHGKVVAHGQTLLRGQVTAHDCRTSKFDITVEFRIIGHFQIIGSHFTGHTAVTANFHAVTDGQFPTYRGIALYGRIPLDSRTADYGKVTTHIGIPVQIGSTRDIQVMSDICIVPCVHVIGSRRTRNGQVLTHIHIIAESGLSDHIQSTLYRLVAINRGITDNLLTTDGRLARNVLVTRNGDIMTERSVARNIQSTAYGLIARNAHIGRKRRILRNAKRTVQLGIPVDRLRALDHGIAFHGLVTAYGSITRNAQPTINIRIVQVGFADDGHSTNDLLITVHLAVAKDFLTTDSGLPIHGLVTADSNIASESSITGHAQSTANRLVTRHGRTTGLHITRSLDRTSGHLTSNRLVTANGQIMGNAQTVRRHFTRNGKVARNISIMQIGFARDTQGPANGLIARNTDIAFQGGIVIYGQSAVHLRIAHHAFIALHGLVTDYRLASINLAVTKNLLTSHGRLTGNGLVPANGNIGRESSIISDRQRTADRLVTRDGSRTRLNITAVFGGRTRSLARNGKSTAYGLVTRNRSRTGLDIAGQFFGSARNLTSDTQSTDNRLVARNGNIRHSRVARNIQRATDSLVTRDSGTARLNIAGQLFGSTRNLARHSQSTRNRLIARNGNIGHGSITRDIQSTADSLVARNGSGTRFDIAGQFLGRTRNLAGDAQSAGNRLVTVDGQVLVGRTSTDGRIARINRTQIGSTRNAQVTANGFVAGNGSASGGHGPADGSRGGRNTARSRQGLDIDILTRQGGNDLVGSLILVLQLDLLRAGRTLRSVHIQLVGIGVITQIISSGRARRRHARRRACGRGRACADWQPADRNGLTAQGIRTTAGPCARRNGSRGTRTQTRDTGVGGDLFPSDGRFRFRHRAVHIENGGSDIIGVTRHKTQGSSRSHASVSHKTAFQAVTFTQRHQDTSVTLRRLGAGFGDFGDSDIAVLHLRPNQLVHLVHTHIPPCKKNQKNENKHYA